MSGHVPNRGTFGALVGSNVLDISLQTVLSAKGPAVHF